MTESGLKPNFQIAANAPSVIAKPRTALLNPTR